jgi:hypothetical protein
MSKLTLIEIFNSPCKIAYFGNSITAQRDGYNEYLHKLLTAKYQKVSTPIKIGIGGVGSLACNFMANQFLINKNPQICFIECFAADMGGATPLEFIGGAVEGLVRKLLSQGIFIIFIYLFRLPTIYSAKNILSIYENIAIYYKIPSVNVYDYIKHQYMERYNEILSDGVHTTSLGASVYAQYIFNSIESFLEESNSSLLPEPINYPLFINTNIFLPTQFDRNNLNLNRNNLFRLSIPYVEIHKGKKIIYETKLLHSIGFLFVADTDCGVIRITDCETNKKFILQLADQWCGVPRIQAAYLKSPLIPKKRITISITSDEKALYCANGQVNTFVHTGKALKIIGFLEYQPDVL